jgi:hypothetical protein
MLLELWELELDDDEEEALEFERLLLLLLWLSESLAALTFVIRRRIEGRDTGPGRTCPFTTVTTPGTGVNISLALMLAKAQAERELQDHELEHVITQR